MNTSFSSELDLSIIPLSPPPPGQESNFINPPSISWSGRLWIYSTMPLALIAVLLRLYVRKKNSQMGADDYSLFAATMTTLSLCGITLPIFLNDVLGRHSWDTPLSAITPMFSKAELASTVLYGISAGLIKVSILVLCLRIFRPSRRAMIFIWLGIVVIPLFYIITLSTAVAYSLVPRAGDGLWDALDNKNSPPNVIFSAQGLGSVISDFYVLAIPVCMVLTLNLPYRRRVGVTCIFLIGLLSCAISTVGAVYRYQKWAGVENNSQSLMTKIAALAAAELNTGIICASMPVAFVLLRTFGQRTEAVYKRLLTYARSRVSSIGGRDSEASRGAEIENPQLDSLVFITGEAFGLSEPVSASHKDSNSQHSME